MWLHGRPCGHAEFLSMCQYTVWKAGTLPIYRQYQTESRISGTWKRFKQNLQKFTFIAKSSSSNTEQVNNSQNSLSNKKLFFIFHMNFDVLIWKKGFVSLRYFLFISKLDTPQNHLWWVSILRDVYHKRFAFERNFKIFSITTILAFISLMKLFIPIQVDKMWLSSTILLAGQDICIFSTDKKVSTWTQVKYKVFKHAAPFYIFLLYIF